MEAQLQLHQTGGLNCEESTPINEVFCLEMHKTSYYLTYCKPGSGSTNSITFKSLPNPDIFYTGICTSICPDILYIGNGFESYSIESTETDTELKDTYESYLSCYPDCNNITTTETNSITISPTGNYPDEVEYVISGVLGSYDSPCVEDINSTQYFTIDLYDSLYYEISPESCICTLCEETPSVDLCIQNISGGIPFNDESTDYYDLLWYNSFDAGGSLLQEDQSTSSSIEISESGEYSIKLVDSNENCDPTIINFTVKDENYLPVELLDFLGTHEKEQIHLIWTSATETNNDYYVIEKSFDGLYFLNWEQFQEVDSVKHPSVTSFKIGQFLNQSSIID
jgi:hypothetical protein